MKRFFNVQELSDKEICFFVAKAQGYNPKTTESYVFLETLDEQLFAWGKYINPYINPIMQKNFDPINNPAQGLKIIEENKISFLYSVEKKSWCCFIIKTDFDQSSFKVTEKRDNFFDDVNMFRCAMKCYLSNIYGFSFCFDDEELNPFKLEFSLNNKDLVTPHKVDSRKFKAMRGGIGFV